MKKTLSMLMAGAMMLTALSGCGGAKNTNTTDTNANKENQAATGEAFKIGGNGPLTGPAAIYGNAAKNGAEIAVEEINATGGIQFELRYEDDENDAEKSVNAYNTLKDWGMQLSLGTVTSTPGAATSVNHYEDGIFALTPSASAPAVIEGKDNVFQMCFSDPNQGSASAKYILDNALGTKIAVIWKNDDVYSKGIYTTFMQKAQELGLDVVSDTTFTASSETDFSVQVADAQKNGADLIFLPMYYTPASLIISQASSIGYTPAFFGVDGMDGILTIDGFDTALAEGVMLLTPFNADATDEATQSFVAKYKERTGDVPNQFAADAYDCIYAYKTALEAVSATPDMDANTLNDLMKETLPTISFDGLTGIAMTWDATGAVSKEPKGMKIVDGTYVGM